jgi:hypothetical protein
LYLFIFLDDKSLLSEVTYNPNLTIFYINEAQLTSLTLFAPNATSGKELEQGGGEDKIKGYMCTIHTTARHKYLPGFSDMPMSASLNSSKSSMVDPLHTETELDLVGGGDTNGGERS